MRIAFLVRGFVTEGKISGGTANYLHQTCLSLIKLGHQPVVFSATRKNSVVFQEGIETRRFQVKDWRLRLIFFITLHQFTRSLTCLYQSRKLNRETMKAHRKNPFDIIHCVNYMAAGLFRPKEIPTVVRISHHLKLWQETNGKTCIHPDRKITHWLEIRAAARADGIFAPSRTIADIIRKETGKPVAVIETPASAEISETDDRLYQNLLAGKDYLLFFGSLDRRKGVDVIAETLPKLLEKHPRLFFVFIGQDSGYQKRIMMSGYLRQKAGPHQKRVLCPGRVTREQLYPVLDNAL
ncbi:MAG: glycosyltransferase family 4 protein, partial [Candidatus Omnitrophota bacterium]